MTNPFDNPVWTPEECDVVIEHYPDYKKIAELLPHRTVRAIQARAQRLNLIAKRAFKGGSRWSADEQAWLFENYADMPQEVIWRRFPNRSWISICNQAKRLGVRRNTRRRYVVQPHRRNRYKTPEALRR
jgi:hypothetical protein